MSNKLLNVNKRSKKTFKTGGFSRDITGVMPCNTDRKIPLLYKFVYSSKVSMFAVLLLMSSFLLQGVQTTFANEPESVDEDLTLLVETETVEVSVPETVPEEDVEEPETSVNDEVLVEALITDDSVNTLIQADEDFESVQNPDKEIEVNEKPIITVSGENFVKSATNTQTFNSDVIFPVNSNVATRTTATTSVVQNETNTITIEDITDGNSGGSSTGISDDDIFDTGSSTDSVSNDATEGLSVEEEIVQIIEASSTSTPDVIPEYELTQSPEPKERVNAKVTEKVDSEEVVSPEVTGEAAVNYIYSTHSNEYVFDKTACVAVGDGSYHCSDSPGEVQNQGEQTFAARGERNNFEIFVRTADGVQQITDNYYDDSSPKYDAESQRLVWHRLMDGRYQIIMYDLQNEVETQLTHGTQNHMEPTISGSNIVWQQWDGNDWEIILYDDGKVSQITDNDSQDVAPVIEDLYIVWTTTGEDTQLVHVYSIESGAMQTITDHEGGAIVNPRFVLVYDTKFDNGDVITRGFDPETGISSSLAATPASEPVDIPPADSTGETRALIQNKSPQREDFSELTIDDLGTANDTSATSSPEAITDLLDLVVGTTTENIESEPLVLTEFDLIITEVEDAPTVAVALATTSSTSTQSTDSD